MKKYLFKYYKYFEKNTAEILEKLEPFLAFQSDLKNHIESINSARSEIKEIPEKITDISKNLENLETSQSEFSHVFETGFEELLGSVRSLNEKLDGVFSDLTEMESRQRLGETLKKDENCFSNFFIIICFFFIL